MDCTDRTNPVDECLPSSAGHKTSEVTQVVRPACAICPKSFSTALGLRRHMARMHRQAANNCVAETADEPISVYIIHCIYIVQIPCIICSNAHYTTHIHCLVFTPTCLLFLTQGVFAGCVSDAWHFLGHHHVPNNCLNLCLLLIVYYFW